MKGEWRDVVIMALWDLGRSRPSRQHGPRRGLESSGEG